MREFNAPFARIFASARVGLRRADRLLHVLGCNRKVVANLDIADDRDGDASRDCNDTETEERLNGGETSAKLYGAKPGETSAKLYGAKPGETSAKHYGAKSGETSAQLYGAKSGETTTAFHIPMT